MIKLTEDRIIQSLSEYLKECDADELARLTGDLFGGECFCRCQRVSNHLFGEEFLNVYEFEPNEFYVGAFGEVKNKNQSRIEPVN